MSVLREEDQTVKASGQDLLLIDSLQGPIRCYKTVACPIKVTLSVQGEGQVGIQRDLSF